MLALLLIHDGRPHLDEVIQSARLSLPWPWIDPKVLVVDVPGDDGEAYVDELERIFPELDVNQARRDEKAGFTGAIRRGWDILRPLAGFDYVFHLEDDFVFETAPPCSSMIEILDRDPWLAQVALARQPVNRREVAAGGMLRTIADLEQCARFDHRWMVHRSFFTTNPSIYPRELLSIGFPDPPDSEAKFGDELVRRGYSFAFAGSPDDPPAVRHLGRRSEEWKP